MSRLLHTENLQIGAKSRHFELQKSEFCLIAGIDGGGKSLFLKTLGGLQTHIEVQGHIYFEGIEISKFRPSKRRKLGISFLGPFSSWLPTESLSQNLRIHSSSKPTASGMKTFVEAASDAFGRRVLADMSLDEFSPSERQILFILVQRYFNQPKLLLIDEATRHCTPAHERIFHQQLEELRSNGCGLIYAAPPYLGDLPDFDRLVWMDRDEVESHKKTKEETTRSLKIDLSKPGRINSISYPPHRQRLSDESLRIQHPSNGFEIKRGEIFGVFIADTQLSKNNLFREWSKSNTLNFQFVSGHRKRLGLFPDLSPEFNLSLPYLLRNRARKLTKESTLLWKHYKTLLRLPSEARVGDYSKLNQNKIILARALSLKPDVLLLDEFSRGIELEFRTEFYRLMRDVADAGVSLLWISREIEELSMFCDRVGVLTANKMNVERSSSDAKDLLKRIQEEVSSEIS